MSATFPVKSHYDFEAVVSVELPYSVTKACNIIVAILNRDGATDVENKTVPVTREVMRSVLGAEIGSNFIVAMRNVAYFRYFIRLEERLRNLGIYLTYNHKFWLIVKIPTAGDVFPQEGFYTLEDYIEHQPANFSK